MLLSGIYRRSGQKGMVAMAMVMEQQETVYKDIASRTGGDIYIGVVGPVRTGKSTLIKRFMETLVLDRKSVV